MNKHEPKLYWHAKNNTKSIYFMARNEVTECFKKLRLKAVFALFSNLGYVLPKNRKIIVTFS